MDIAGGIEFYGIPVLDGRGLKIRYLAARFPALKDAPLAETRVCQYERTADSHLILDRHPQWENVWIAGGGSGHGFKLGPAVGRVVAACVADKRRDAIPAELRFW